MTTLPWCQCPAWSSHCWRHPTGPASPQCWAPCPGWSAPGCGCTAAAAGSPSGRWGTAPAWGRWWSGPQTAAPPPPALCGTCDPGCGNPRTPAPPHTWHCTGSSRDQGRVCCDRSRVKSSRPRWSGWWIYSVFGWIFNFRDNTTWVMNSWLSSASSCMPWCSLAWRSWWLCGHSASILSLSRVLGRLWRPLLWALSTLSPLWTILLNNGQEYLTSLSTPTIQSQANHLQRG